MEEWFRGVGRVYCVAVVLRVGCLYCVAVVLRCFLMVVISVFGIVWVGEVGGCSIGWNLGLKLCTFLFLPFFVTFVFILFR